MTRLSNWKEESDLFEVVTGKMTDEKALKKVDEKKGIKNKVVINPKLTEAIKELGGELIEATEEDENGGTVDPRKEADKKSEEQKKKQVEQKQKRAQMIKKQVLMKKLIAVRQGSEDIVAGYEPEGETIDEAERKLADRLARKRKLYDKTTRKAMDDARRTGEASGHNRFNMSRLGNEMDKVKDKMNKEAKVYGYQGGGKVMGYQGGGKVMGYEGGGKVMGYQQGGLVKKELKSLKKGAKTLKGKNIAKADSM